MNEAEKQALEIYELICATSGDRPFAFRSMEEMNRVIAEWRANNPGLTALRNAGPEVQVAFLSRCLEWLQAETRRGFENAGPCATVGEAIRMTMEAAPKPLPAEIVLRLLRDYRQDSSMARFGFPLLGLLSTLTREQVTEEIRAELKRLYPQFAPSATGKIDERNERRRKLIAELMYVEGEKQLDEGRGPWSQIIFDELKEREELSRAGWEGLLAHCRALEQTAPGAKWNKRTREMMNALGETEAFSTMLRWLELGPTPGQPREAASPIEDSAYQKGVVWCLGMSREREVAVAIAEFTLACLRKIPMIGAVSQKVGFAGVQALGAMECPEAVAQLTRLRAKVKYTMALKLIEKSLAQAAERSGITTEELEDISVDGFGLDGNGVAETVLGDATVSLWLGADGAVGVSWRNADGKLVKAAPPHVKKAFGKEVRGVAARAKELEQAYMAQRVRLESSFVAAREIPLEHWRKHYIEHPLLGFLGRRLIWVFSDGNGWERAAMWADGAMRGTDGEALELSTVDAAIKVRLWHPLAQDEAEVQRWRERVFAAGIRQPFRQAFRESYQVTNAERETRMYSNRFAGVYMRQHQLASLCRARSWEYRLMSTSFDGHNVPTKKLACWNMQVEMHVDLPPDRDGALHQSGLGEQSGLGINLFVGSDQVRFFRERREVAVDEVPAIVYSEVMRDVDLFTSVCAIGEDESWIDQGDRGVGVPVDGFDVGEVSEVMRLRGEMLARVLPSTPVADRCKVEEGWLIVRGQLGSYRVQLGWGSAMLVTESGIRRLQIPQRVLNAVVLDLASVPIELDYRTETVLRKAYVLADDWKIEDPELVRQLMPR